jgi:hypothetical protein
MKGRFAPLALLKHKLHDGFLCMPLSMITAHQDHDPSPTAMSSSREQQAIMAHYFQTGIIIMGPQSQVRGGSVDRCRTKGAVFKRKNSKKYYQSTVGNLKEEAFNAIKHCLQCKHEYLRAADPTISVRKKKHDSRCSRGLLKGKSQRAFNDEKYLKAMEEKAKEPIGKAAKGLRSVTACFEKAFGTTTTTCTTTTTPGGTCTTTTTPRVEASKPTNKETSSSIPLILPNTFDSALADGTTHGTSTTLTHQEVARFLSKELDRQMELMDPPKEAEKDVGPPLAFTILIKIIQAQFKCKKSTDTQKSLPTTLNFKDAYRRYQLFFPNGKMIFEFPEQEAEGQTPPSPHYHSMVGNEYCHMDLQLSHPKVDLRCYECNVPLQFNRCEYGHNRTLQRILHDKKEVWASYVTYRCTNTCCNVSLIRSNDGRLLASLPAYMRNRYPVSPKYALDRYWHISRQLSEELCEYMLTQSSADVFVKNIYRRKTKKFEERLEDYLSLPTIDDKDYVQLEEMIVTYPPDGSTLREIYYNAEKSSLSSTGISNHDRAKREIQSVECKELFSTDHVSFATRLFHRNSSIFRI